MNQCKNENGSKGDDRIGHWRNFLLVFPCLLLTEEGTGNLMASSPHFLSQEGFESMYYFRFLFLAPVRLE